MDALLAVVQLFQRQYRIVPLPSGDCTGKAVIVTGANGGLGLEAARHFVRLNAAQVILACRDLDKGEAARRYIEELSGCTGVVEVWHLDLSAFQSVKDFCTRAEKLDRLDIVVENAGWAPAEFTVVEGYESMTTVNVISTALMALMLLPVLRRTSTKFNILPHLVIVSSDGHRFVHVPIMNNEPDIFEVLRTDRNLHERYNVTKLINLLFVRELARNIDRSEKPKVIVNAVNPGYCSSNLFRYIPAAIAWIEVTLSFMFARTCEVGARNLVAAGLGGPKTQGALISECAVIEVSPRITTDAGIEDQKKVYDELLQVLNQIEPGVSANI